MSPKRALQIVLAISLAGIAFSGTLSYLELFSGAPGCTAGGTSGTMFGLPFCVYGLIMYAIVAVVTILGLRGTRETGDVPTMHGSARV